MADTPTWLSGIGQGLSGLAGVGQFALGLHQMIAGIDKDDRSAWRSWVAASEPRRRQIESILPAPWAVGEDIPYMGGEWTKWGESGLGQYTQDIYKSYLSREYGLPEEIAQARVGQAITSLRPANLGQLTTPAQFVNQIQPNALAEAIGRINQVAYDSQQNYLRNAAEIATYNAMKAKQAYSLVG